MKDLSLLQSTDGKNYGNFNDLIIDNFDIGLVDGTQRIQQQICKFLLTEFGSVPLFPNYGTIISSLLNNRINETTISQIKDEVDSGLKYVKSMNNANNETLNIDKVIGENFSIVDARTIQITLAILLTDGTYLQIIQPAMVK